MNEAEDEMWGEIAANAPREYPTVTVTDADGTRIYSQDGTMVSTIDEYTGHTLSECRDALCPHQRLLGY